MQAMVGDNDDEMAEEGNFWKKNSLSFFFENLEDAGPNFEFDENGKKIGKRKAAKLQAKEEKRQQREYVSFIPNFSLLFFFKCYR